MIGIKQPRFEDVRHPTSAPRVRLKPLVRPAGMSFAETALSTARGFDETAAAGISTYLIGESLMRGR